jgi:O-antigen/teichoic acid export membrane protein
MPISRPALQPLALARRWLDEPLLRNSAIYLAGSVGAGALGYVFHFASGRLLGPAGYGVVASAVSSLYLLSLPGLVLQIVATRFTSLAAGRGELGDVRPLIIRLGGLGLAVGLPLALALALLAPVFAAYLRIGDVRIVYLLAVTTAVSLVLAVNRGALQGLSRFLALSVNLVLDLGTRVVMAVGLVLLGGGVLAAVLAVLLGPLLAYLHSFLLLLRVQGAHAAEVAGAAEVGRYAMSAAVAAIGVTFLFNADVILAKHYLPSGQAGLYAAGSVLGRVVYFLGTTVAAVMFPEVAALHARDERHFHVVDMSLVLLAALAAALIAAYVILPQVVLLPFGTGFGPVRPYLVPFAVALSLLAMANLLVNYFLSVNSRRFVIPLVLACLLETGLIASFHRDPAQIVDILLVSMGALAAALGGMYAVERFRPRPLGL